MYNVSLWVGDRKAGASGRGVDETQHSSVIHKPGQLVALSNGFCKSISDSDVYKIPNSLPGRGVGGEELIQVSWWRKARKILMS